MPVTTLVSWETLHQNVVAMSTRDNVWSKYWCSSLAYVTAARTRVAKFLSMPAKVVESGLGRILPFMKLIISNLPVTVVASGCGGGGTVSGDTMFPGTTSCIVGNVAALNISVLVWVDQGR